MQTRNILDVLPVELAVAVLGYVDHKDVLHFRLCSRACDQLVKTGQEQIHESIAHRILRVGTPTTAGDSGITPTTILPQEEECSDGSSTAGTLSPLKQAIANQRTASTVFQSVTTWTELGQSLLLFFFFLTLRFSHFREAATRLLSLGSAADMASTLVFSQAARPNRQELADRRAEQAIYFPELAQAPECGWGDQRMALQGVP